MHQGIQERHVRWLGKSLKFGQIAAVGSGEAFQDQNDDILGTEGRRVRRDMDRIENRPGLVFRLEIMRVAERVVAQGPVHAECRIEDHACLERTVGIQVGVVQRNRTDGHAEAAPHPADDRIDHREQDGRDRRIKRIYPTEFAQTQKTFLQGIIRAWVRYLAAGMEQAEVETTIRGFHDAAKRACELRIPDDVARCLEKGE